MASSRFPAVAYVNTSALVAITQEELPAPDIARRLATFQRLLSSNLLEAEIRSVFAREGRAFNALPLSRIEWVFPHRSLGPELEFVLQVGYLHEADLWHVATALYIARTLGAQLAFMTLDGPQQRVTAGLGFVV